MFIGTGTVVNASTVLVGSTLGVLVGHRLPLRTRSVVTDALGLVTLLIAASSATAVSGVTVPLVHTSMMSRSCPPAWLSTWKFTRLTGEKSASISIALMGRASGSRFSAGW